MNLAELALKIFPTGENQEPEAEPELAPRVEEELLRLALAFLRAGGRPELEWFADPLERRIWSRAGELLELERAQRIGLATRGELGSALAGADLDGGRAAAGVLVRAVAARVAASRRPA